MADLKIEVQTFYDPRFASEYDELLASLHMTESWTHEPFDIHAVCESATSNFYIATLAECAVAMATLIKPVDSLGHRTAILEDVATHRAYRGQGIGDAVVSSLEDESRSFGATRIELHSRYTREAAQRLYRRHGFVEVETTLFRKDLD